MEGSCELCNGLRGHEVLKESLRVPFRKMLRDAEQEYVERLDSLLSEICWFNFEVNCKTWSPPWYTSIMDTLVILHGVRYAFVKNGGRVYECGEYPVYYEGPVRDAEAVPPEIVLAELRAAATHVHECKELLLGVDTYAPGGIDYLVLAEMTTYRQAMCGV